MRPRLLLIRALFVLALLPGALTFGYTTLRLTQGPQAVGGPFPGMRRWIWVTSGPWWPLLDVSALLPTLDRDALVKGDSPAAVWTRFIWKADATIPRAREVAYLGRLPDWSAITFYYLYPRTVTPVSTRPLLARWVAEHPHGWVVTGEASSAKLWLGENAVLAIQEGENAIFRPLPRRTRDD